MPFRFLQLVVVFVAVLVLFVARVYLLPDGALPDYDTVENWQVAKEISQGDFSRLFFHRSPLFNLFYGGLVTFVPALKHLVLVNAAFNVLAVFLLCRLVFCRLQLRYWQFALLLLVTGLSVFMVHTSRYLTVESAGLPAFALFLTYYLRRSENHHVKNWYWSVFWLAIGILINYKFVLLLPVLLVLEWLQPTKILTGKVVVNSVLVLIAPALVFCFFGWLMGLRWYQYPATYFGITQFNTPNAAMRTGKFQSDLSFYFRYLFSFESPLVWVGLILYPLVCKPWQYFRKQSLGMADVLAVISFCFLAGMSVLLKAPRGLVFVYVPMYLLGFLCLRQLLKQKAVALYAVLVLSVLYSCFSVYRHIYQYSQTGYAEMAHQIKSRKIKQVGQTVGNGLVPFAAENNFTLTPLVYEADFANLLQQKPAWLVTDTYYLVTNIQRFDSLSTYPAAAEVNSPALLSPLLFLEHAEFTGYGYSKTMQLRNKAMQQPAQLRLVQLP